MKGPDWIVTSEAEIPITAFTILLSHVYKLLHRQSDAVLIVAGRDVVSRGLDLVDRVAHGHLEVPRQLEVSEVIVVVAKYHGFFGLDVQKVQQSGYGLAF